MEFNPKTIKNLFRSSTFNPIVVDLFLISHKFYLKSTLLDYKIPKTYPKVQIHTRPWWSRTRFCQMDLPLGILEYHFWPEKEIWWSLDRICKILSFGMSKTLQSFEMKVWFRIKIAKIINISRKFGQFQRRKWIQNNQKKFPSSKFS